MSNAFAVMYVLLFSIAFTDKFVAKIIDITSRYGFTQLAMVPGFAFYQNQDGDKLTFNQNQIVLETAKIVSRETAAEMLAMINEIIKEVYNAEPTSVMLRLTSIESTETGDAFGLSKTFISEVASNGTVGDEIGVGLRFFVNVSGNVREFKIEPYIADPKFLYFEGVYNNRDTADVTGFFNESVEDYIARKGYSSHIFR